MRYLKFKVWDKKQKKMFDVYSLGKDFVSVVTDDGIDPGVNCFDGDSFRDNIVVLQYTGLQDKNGTDIYEGDIVKAQIIAEYVGHESEEIYKDVAAITFECGSYHVDEFPLMAFGTSDIEVIGNIYENPELL